MFNQKIEPYSLSEKLITLTFSDRFDQKIEPNSLPENLSNLIFKYNFNFDQIIDPNILPINTILIFNWFIIYNGTVINKTHIDAINNIPNYYNVKIFTKYNFPTAIDELKWTIHVPNCYAKCWPLKIYHIVKTYNHAHYGDMTILINKETYEPYSSAKSTLK